MLEFWEGSNLYVEKFFSTTPAPLTDANPEYVANVTPGGYLRGVRLELRSTGGTGAVTYNIDGLQAIIKTASLENVDGSQIIYPIGGLSYAVTSYYINPWLGNYAQRFDFNGGVNPAFSFFYSVEVRRTGGVLPNLDSRAQYRFRFTLGNLATVYTVQPATLPNITVTLYVETWARPDKYSVHGEKVDQIPIGLGMARILRKQTIGLSGTGGQNIIQLSNVGNYIRAITMIFRNNSGGRTDAFMTGQMEVRNDNRKLGTYTDQEIFNQIADFYSSIGVGRTARTAGSIVFPRFYLPGDMYGSPWLPTTNATFLTFEFTSGSGFGAGDGNVEVITDEIVPIGPIPDELVNS